MTTKKMASLIATAAAIAFITAPMTSTFAMANSKKVPCYGVNACKGKSECKTANNACNGQNDCKGKGYVMKTAKSCKKSGGKTEEPNNS